MDTYQEIFTALADPTRRALFETLRSTPCSVTELAAQFPVSRPAVSQHLKVLKRAQLVTEEPQGTRRIYAINPSGIETLRDYVDGFWDDVLEAYRRQAAKEKGASS